MGSISVVVPTLHRPKDLLRLIGFLLKQDIEEEFELIIVDQSKNNLTRDIVAESLADSIYKKHKMIVRYAYRPDITSLTQARNFGLSLVSRDVVIFFDDDSVPASNCLSSMVSLFQNVDDDVAAIGTQVIEPKERSFFSANIFYKWCYGSSCGAMSREKYPEPIPANCLSGCSAAFRTRIVKKILFDEAFVGYSLGEDMEISFRLTKLGYRILFNPHTFIMHYPSQENRLPRANIFSDRVFNCCYIFRKNVPKNIENTAAFGLMFIGLWVRCLNEAIQKRCLSPVKGHIHGLLRIAKAYKKGDFQSELSRKYEWNTD